MMGEIMSLLWARGMFPCADLRVGWWILETRVLFVTIYLGVAKRRNLSEHPMCLKHQKGHVGVSPTLELKGMPLDRFQTKENLP